ncbi:thioredoxin fold domain-containing protein [Pontibacter sp. JAM-7]|uniref:thioredoxin fold domain-containing protein n=1 Tax=Pontibacter sp. JAM-7 TaxID=3366581 RepID=UPI003AF5C0FD
MKKTVALLGCLLWAGMVTADDDVAQRITENLQQVDARIEVKSIKEAPIAGLHEVTLSSGDVLYANDAGEYFLIGQLYQFSKTDGFVNLTEAQQKVARRELMAKVADEDTVIFPPEGEVKATIDIFTDVDCPYCRKLHQEVPKLNAMGVKVRYLAFPRKGEGSSTYAEMVSIWCAEGEARRTAMTDVKSGAKLPPASCDNPVKSQYLLGKDVGVNGTPATVLEDGTLIPGYMPAANMARILGVQ